MPYQYRPAPRLEGGLVFGVLIMALGIALLLDRAGVVTLFGSSSFWPFVIIAFGLVKLAHRYEDGRREGGWWVFFGAWLLLNQTLELRFRDSWPLFLVALGISMAWKALVRRPPTRERVE